MPDKILKQFFSKLKSLLLSKKELKEKLLKSFFTTLVINFVKR